MIQHLPYQLEDVQKIERHGGRVSNNLEMGLGKTFETLWSLKRNPDWLPALVVCPASVKLNWQLEAKNHWSLTSKICSGRSPDKFNSLDILQRPDITIINYDILRHWLPYLKNQGFRTLVCDECQDLQNLDSLRTRATMEIAGGMRHVQMLSGTPFGNRPVEFFPALHMLWPHLFPSFTQYARTHCKPRYTRWGWTYNGAENLDVLHELLQIGGHIRRRWADVAPQMPPKVRRVVPCELMDRDEYERASEDFLRYLRETAAHRVQAAERAESLTRLSVLMQISARLKLKSCVNWYNDFLERNPSEKLIVSAIHGGAIDVLQRRIKFKSTSFIGGLTDRKKQDVVDQFREDPETRVIILSRAGWRAINCQIASTTGVTEMFWRPSDHLQLEGRSYRIGQTGVSRYYYFVGQGTVEERICDLLQTKQEVISAVLDGGSQPGDLNIYELYMREVQKTL